MAVDLNPLAVELAKLSIWLVTLAKGRPFGFLDHNVRCGDSLLGIHRLDQLTELDMAPTGKGQRRLFGKNIEKAVHEAIDLRQQLRKMPIRDIHDVEVMTRLDADARQKLEVPERVADALIGEFFAIGRSISALESGLALLAIRAGEAIDGNRDAIGTITSRAKSLLSVDLPASTSTRRAFHWPLEFPEVFSRSNAGFDAVIGNPPFIGGTLATESMGNAYTSFLQRINPPWHGKADYVVGFFKRATKIINASGKFSFVSTASLLRGETLDSGLRELMKNGWRIYSANSPYKWPGTATLEVVNISLSLNWKGPCFLDGHPVVGIDEELSAGNPNGRTPKELHSTQLTGYLGIKLCPANRELSYRNYLSLIQNYPDAEKFFVPTLGGEELYGLTDFTAAPRAIDPDKLRSYISMEPQFHSGKELPPYNPATLSHSAPASGLRTSLANAEMAFACGETSTALRFCQVPKQDCILKHKLIVFPANSWSIFAVLQSEVHVQWAWRWGLRRESRIVYSPKRCGLTFPLPSAITSQLSVGQLDLDFIGKAYHDFRRELMDSRLEGLTKTYNRFHDPGEVSDDIRRLRGLQVELDQTLISAYGWSDLDLGHANYVTSQGYRYTISETARLDLLDRLLSLNHQRAESGTNVELHRVTSTKKRGERNHPMSVEPEIQPGLFERGR